MPRGLRWVRAVDGDGIPEGPEVEGAGEEAARRRWKSWLQQHLGGYDRERDRPDLDTTSRMSVPLKFGELHPRTLLADIAAHPASGTKAARTFVSELCWREFYADVLWHNPASRGTTSDPRCRPWTTPGRGRSPRPGRGARPATRWSTPGCASCLPSGWMHNRVRMITASFLVKDLHVWWPHGARHFLAHLRDGDIASNNHGWQWVAGTGTDAAPYFRVFNPVTQGLRFDPDGEYVRRCGCPSCATCPARPPTSRGARGRYAEGYQERIVDHAAERDEALRRYEAARS